MRISLDQGARRFIGFGAAVILAAAAAACGTSAETGAADAAGQADRIEVLRIGAPGQVGDALNPLLTNGIADYTSVFHIYDTLVRLTDDGVELAAAESIEPNDDATEWTIRVRDGATFHDGTPVTGNDVVASFALMADPDVSPNYAGFFADIDVAASRAPDGRTAVIALSRPRGDFVDTMLTFASFVFKEGATDWQDPVGSGPYRLESYEPGGTTVLVANDEHWEGEPTVERLEIATIADPSARLNGVGDGQLDVAMRIDPVGATAAGDDVAIVRGGTAFANAITVVLNTTVAPFDDIDVRRAVALAIDRQALVDTVLLGYGTVGNDIVGAGLPGYANEIPQITRDVDTARDLFADAGVSEMTLIVADVTPGVVAAGELIVEQLAQAGVTVTLDRRDPATYYGDFGEFLARPAQGMYWVNRPAPAFLGNFTGSTSFFNPSAFGNSNYDAALAAAQAETDPEQRTELFVDLQQQFHDNKGNVIWGYQELLDATTPGIEGIVVVQSIPLFSQVTSK